MPVTLLGYERVHNRLVRLSQGPTKQDLDRVGTIGVSKVKSNFQAKSKKGSSVAVNFRLLSSGLELVCRELKGIFMHYGTAPHAITPSRKSTLRFVGKQGKTIFTKTVAHPGTRAWRWMSIPGETKQAMLGVLKEFVRR